MENSSHLNATKSHWYFVNIGLGKGLVPSDLYIDQQMAYHQTHADLPNADLL